MEEFARTIFQNAVIKENVAKKKYMFLAEKTKSKEIKEIFNRLASEEELHERLLSKFNLNVLKIANNNQIKNLNLLKNIDKDLSKDEIKDINKVLDGAISDEQKAYEDYATILKYIEFGESREVLDEISIQELKHKTLLQKVKLNFNDDEWRFIKNG